MQILCQKSNSTSAGYCVVLFGLGLIGSEISLQLKRSGAELCFEQRMPWLDHSRYSQILQQLEIQLGSIATEANHDRPRNLKLLWSAGKAGFSAGEKDTEIELAVFQRFLRSVESIEQKGCFSSVSVILISSIGGLFEGQRLVSRGSTPTPLRPYGDLKLRQEACIAELPRTIRHHILRVTSVYGIPRTGQRRGLIPTFIVNGLTQRITNISGSLTTLRDFIWNADIGKAVLQILREPIDGDRISSNTHVLASAKPSSIMEIQQAVEEVVGRKLYIALSSTPSNMADISVSPKLTARFFSSSELRVCVRNIYLDIVRSGMSI